MVETTLGLRLIEHVKDTLPVGAGKRVFQAGQKGSCMYVVKSGRLEIRIGGVVVENVGPGGIFGEMALLNENEVRSATVLAVEDSVVVPIDEARFEFLVQNVPSFAIELMRIFARRLLEMNKRVRAPQ